MIKVAILGSDSTHTEAYTELVNRSGAPFYKKARVLWLWGADFGQARRKAARLGIPHIVRTPEEAVRDADFVMVLNRFGEDHFRNAKIAIEAGKPIYVDKPLTNNPTEAEQLFHLSQKKCVPLISFSPYRFSREVARMRSYAGKIHPFAAVITAPYASEQIKDSRADNIYFYGIHAAEILFSVFGSDIRSVSAVKSDSGIVGTTIYRDGRHAILHLLFCSDELYHVTLLGGKEIRESRIDPRGDFYKRSLGMLLGKFLKGDTTFAPFQDSIKSIHLLQTIEKQL